jgi:hypothetical protein
LERFIAVRRPVLTIGEPLVRAPHLPRVLASALVLVALLLPAGPAGARRSADRAERGAAPEPPTLVVQPMGARAPAATDVLRARMREHVARQLRPLIDGRVLTSPQGYVVDGSIDTLDIVARADGLEISCSVRLILSARRSGAMLAMTTGQAMLKDGRRARGAAAEARLAVEVLDGAVRAASEELLEHFEARRKT